jgi:hypothetical protein
MEMGPLGEQVLRLVALCVTLASAETLHGIFRAAVLVPRIGKAKALRVSIVTGTVLAFVVCYFFVPGLGLSGAGPLLAVGAILALFMAAFDVAIGRLVMRRPWARIAEEFDPRSGNYLLLGLAVLVFIPWAVMACRGGGAP